MKCNFCDGVQAIEIYPHIFQCTDCKLVYAENMKSIDEYRKPYGWPHSERERIINADTRARMEWIGCVRTLSILEIGCSHGDFLLALKQNGADVVGIEPNPQRRGDALAKGLCVHEHPIESQHFAGLFDAVVLFHTLEHVENPKSTLGAIWLSLKDGGKCYGEVPNQRDWRISVFDDAETKAVFYDMYHNYFFTPQSIHNYLDELGFRDIRISTVERYNTTSRLARILGNRSVNIEDDRCRDETTTERRFNHILSVGINQNLLGSCIRWVARK